MKIQLNERSVFVSLWGVKPGQCFTVLDRPLSVYVRLNLTNLQLQATGLDSTIDCLPCVVVGTGPDVLEQPLVGTVQFHHKDKHVRLVKQVADAEFEYV